MEYKNHRAAAMARRKLLTNQIELWGQKVAVDWAEPEPEVDEEVMSKVSIFIVLTEAFSNIYIRISCKILWF